MPSWRGDRICLLLVKEDAIVKRLYNDDSWEVGGPLLPLSPLSPPRRLNPSGERPQGAESGPVRLRVREPTGEGDGRIYVCCKER